MQLLSKTRVIITFFTLLLGWSVIPSVALAQTTPPQEYISNFDATYQIQQDTSLRVTERITYFTDQRKHGIFRYIPTRLQHGNFVRTTPITDISVTDEQGEPHQFTQESDNGNQVLKIGDPTATFTGQRIYIISYTVENALTQHDDYLELFWDITGEGWQVLIRNSSAVVQSEFATITRVTCYSGIFGGDDGYCDSTLSEDASSAAFDYTKPIEYNHNFTLAVQLSDDNQLQLPGTIQQLQWWLSGNFWLLFLPLPTLVFGLLWLKKGRDRVFVSGNMYDLDPKQPQRLRGIFERIRVPFVYEPFKQLSAGEAGVLVDYKVDTQDVVAEILELARKKYLSISSTESSSLFGFKKKRDYSFTKLAGKKKLTPAQELLHTALFKKGNTVAVSDLKGTFYKDLAKIKKKLQDTLIQHDVYETQPTSTRLAHLPVAMVLMPLAFGTAIYPATTGLLWPLGLSLLQIPIGLLLLWNLPRKTAIGTNLVAQVKGLRKSIAYGKWREEIKEKNLFVEEVLPFAVALGVVDQLTRDMEDLNMEVPEYLSDAGLQAATLHTFANTFSQDVGSSLAYNPNASSSYSSGGSGFSGGSSGGGGGGGGGGSW